MTILLRYDLKKFNKYPNISISPSAYRTTLEKNKNKKI